MAYKPIYDNPILDKDATAVISYISPLGKIDTFMFTRIPPDVLQSLIRLLRPYEKRNN